jgi:hypothetical protein
VSPLDFLERFLTEHKFIALFDCLKAQATLKSHNKLKTVENYTEIFFPEIYKCPLNLARLKSRIAADIGDQSVCGQF